MIDHRTLTIDEGRPLRVDVAIVYTPPQVHTWDEEPPEDDAEVYIGLAVDACGQVVCLTPAEERAVREAA